MEFKCAKRSKSSKDRFSELPDDILSFTLSFLPIREALRTSILSCRWRYLWKDSVKFSSSINLDVIRMRGDDNMSSTFLQNRQMTPFQRCKFAIWVDQILQLDYGPLLDTFRLRFEMTNDFFHYIDKWISVAIAKRVKRFDIDLLEYHPWRHHPNNNLYMFPDRLFTNEAAALVKCLYLRSCVFWPRDFKCFSSLIELKLDDVFLDQDNLAKFLTGCPNLETMWLVGCYKLRSLIISGSSLKELIVVSYYEGLSDVKINARSLNKLEYRGVAVKFSFDHVPELSNLSMVCRTRNSSALRSFLGKLSTGLPKLETLFLVLNQLEICEERIPSQLLSYKNLRKLAITVVDPDQSLWGVASLLCASPCLHELELHLYPSDRNLRSDFSVGQRPSDSPHLHLKEILVTGFFVSNHKLELMQYLFKNCEALQTITLDSTCKSYDPMLGLRNVNYHDEMVLKKRMHGRVQKLLSPLVPSGVELVML